MISSLSNYSSVSRMTRDVVDVHRVNRTVNIEKVHIQKDIVTTNLIHTEKINYVYNVQHRTVHQPVNAMGNTLNVMA